MQNKSGVYRIRNILNNDCYIGSAIKLVDRKNTHYSALRRNIHHSIILQNAVNKYGINNFSFELIEYTDKNSLIIKEQHYIDTLLPKYNICKIAGNSLGRISTRKIAILQYDLQGNLVREWDCLQRIMEGFNLSNSTKISHCCQGKRNKCYGYVWRYKDSNLPFSISLERKGKSIHQIDEQGKIVRSWKRVKDCAIDIGSTSSTIINNMKNKKSVNGLFFKRD